MRQVDEGSASLKDYQEWLYDRLGLKDRDIKRYSKLFDYLLNLEFIWIHPRDENRAADGKALREQFTYETGLYLDGSSGLMPQCTVFEMIAALAIRMEDQLLRNLELGDRTYKWFFLMLENCGLDKYHNRAWNQLEVRDICDKFMHRIYKKNGKGGLFYTKRRDLDLKNEEIWRQCMTYINENLLNETPDLALYS